jgi:1-deoxyxylulose-5-phosphate synthase
MRLLCREKKIRVIAYSPLASGRLTRDWSSERTHRSENWRMFARQTAR